MHRVNGFNSFLAALCMLRIRQVHSCTLEYCAVPASCRSICASFVWVSFESLGRLLSVSPLATSTAVAHNSLRACSEVCPGISDIMHAPPLNPASLHCRVSNTILRAKSDLKRYDSP